MRNLPHTVTSDLLLPAGNRAAGCDSEVDWLLGLKMTKMNNRRERIC